MQHLDTLVYFSSTGLAIPISPANTSKKRFLGLAGRAEGVFGLLMQPCNLLHTYFVKYKIDIVFLDRQNHIVEIKRLIGPFSIVPSNSKAHRTLLFPSSLNATAFLSNGDKIKLLKNLD